MGEKLVGHIGCPFKKQTPSISLYGRQCASVVLSKGDLLPLNYSGTPSSAGIPSKTPQEMHEIADGTEPPMFLPIRTYLR